MGTTSTTTFGTTTINFIVDNASTTEAVYIVGYAITLYLGIFVALTFGFLSYKFFKGYL